jgi:hypothetical protein
MRIYKYTIDITEPYSSIEGLIYREIRLPIGSKILSIGYQKTFFSIWVLVDENVVNFEQKKVFFIETGQVVPEWIQFEHFKGTFRNDPSSGSYIEHVFIV